MTANGRQRQFKHASGKQSLRLSIPPSVSFRESIPENSLRPQPAGRGGHSISVGRASSNLAERPVFGDQIDNGTASSRPVPAILERVNSPCDWSAEPQKVDTREDVLNAASSAIVAIYSLSGNRVYIAFD